MIVRRVARPMLAAAFIIGGLDQFRHPGTKTQAAAPLVNRFAEPVGLPNDPELLVRANGATMLAAGALLATGRFPRLASSLLAASVVPTTVAAHAFWDEEDPEKRKAQRTQFMKNVGLLGGLLLAAVDTEGKPGLVYRAKLAGEGAQRVARTTRREARHAARSAAREARLKAAQAQNALT